MSTLSATHFEQIKRHSEAVAESVQANARRAEKVRTLAAFIALLPTLPTLYLLDRALGKSTRYFALEFNAESKEELKTCAHELRSVHLRLAKVLAQIERLGIKNYFPYRRALATIEEQNEYLHSIVEGMYMSLNDGFGPVIADSIDQLKAAIAESAACQNAK